MKKAFVVAFAAILLAASVVAVAGEPVVVVVIIGGWGSDADPGQLQFLQKFVPGSVAIAPNRYWPLTSAAADVLRQLKERGVFGELVLVGHSWGGLIARQIDAENPGRVKKIITIGTPNGGFWFAPWFVWGVEDQKSPTPLCAIAGAADEVVAVQSALDAGRRASDLAVFAGLSHVGLLGSAEVAGQVKSWIE